MKKPTSRTPAAHTVTIDVAFEEVVQENYPDRTDVLVEMFAHIPPPDDSKFGRDGFYFG